ncbi:O-antigen ligase family protein, partial [bacterium]|nr:O-antigen ligase family protein [bacterium]
LIVLSALFLLKNPKRFILALIIVMAGWQGGYWFSFLQIDVLFSHILIIILFIYSLLSPSKLRIRDRFAIPLLIPMGGIIVCAIIAAFRAVNQGPAFGGVFTLVSDCLLIVCIISTIEKPQDVVFLLNSLLVTLCFQIIITLLQYRMVGFRIGIIDEEFSHLQWWRMHGTFVHPNQFGMFLMFVLPFVFRYLVIVASNKKRKLTIVTIIIFLLGGFALYTTQNRGSQIALVIGLFITFAIDIFRKKMRIRKILVKISVVLFILICVAMIRYGNRIYYQYFMQRSNIYSQLEGRASLNQEAIPRIKASLPFGIGMKNYESIIYPGYTVHNLYLLVVAEIGIGIVFFVWVLFYLIYKSIKLMRIQNIILANLGSACLATLIGFFISSWVGPDWFSANQVRMNFWIVMGIVVGTEKLWNRLENQNRLLQRKKMQEHKENSYRPIIKNGQQNNVDRS